MPIVPLSYRFSGNGRLRSCGFNDATGEIGAVSQGIEVDFSDPNLRDVGYIVYTGGGYDLKVIEAYPYFFAEPAGGGGGPACDLDIIGAIATNNTAGESNPPNGELEVQIDGNGLFEYRITKTNYDSGWVGLGEMGYTFTGLAAGDYTIYVRDLESVGCQRVALASVIDEGGVVYDDLTAQALPYNETSPENNDGKIEVTIFSGSGTFRITWSDATTTDVNTLPGYANKFNLAAGTHNITIEDLITGQELNYSLLISEPVIVPPAIGDFLEFPLLNPFHFVIEEEIDNVSIFQRLDNCLFKNQYFPGFKKGTEYFHKVCKADTPIQQFNSNYPTHEMKLKDYYTNEVVKVFPVVQKATLIDATEDYGVTIRNHPGFVGKSRVYFNVIDFPLPLEVGDNFTVINNADGFDGGYQIQSIETDTTLNRQYLVINLTYDAPGAISAATGRFLNSEENFNVFETLFNFLDVAEGKYYLECKAIATVDNFKIGVSDPIHIKVSHPKTCMIVATNEDNAYDITWTTGFVLRKRVDGIIGHKRLPGGERSVSRTSSFDLVKTSSKKSRGMLFETFMLPPYEHECLSVLFDLDFFTINGDQFQSSDGYEEPQYINRFKLANSSIKLEQVGWFRNYNSHDVGSVEDSGFITTQSGFLKR